MGYRYRHLGLFVADLEVAEAFYGRTFGMEVLFREAVGENGLWYTMPPGTGWEEAEVAGIEIQFLALGLDDLVLPLIKGAPQPGTVLEIGLEAEPDEIEAIDRRLPENANRRSHEHGDLYFEDPFGFVWHVTSAGEPFLSNGVSTGRWLEA